MPKARTEYRICLEHTDGTTRKVAHITANSAGFYVSAPYHTAKKGYFIKVRPKPGTRLQWIDFHNRSFVASSRAKLSFHPPSSAMPDSFLVHFSGHGIVSGLDENEKPKGLALLGPPMQEITSGPTFGLAIWGLQDFTLPRARDVGVVCIERSEMIESESGAASETGYRLEFFLFPNSARKAKRKLPTFFQRFTLDGVERGFNLRVIELPELDSFLGVVCLHQVLGFGAPSGFTISSPCLYGWMLAATYPQPKLSGSERTLDFSSPPPIESTP